MSACHPFDRIVVGQTSIGLEALVPGSAALSIKGEDKSVPCLDGTFALVRVSVMKEASFKALGDLSAIASRQGWPSSASLHLGGVQVAAFDAIASVSYDENSNLSSVALKSSPESA